MRIDEHWRTVAEHEMLFADELDALLVKLAVQSNIGVRYDPGTKERVFRTRLTKSQYFVYYAFNIDEIVLLSVWSAFRRRQPRL